MSPSMRSLGRSPAVTCRSEASRSIISSSNWRRLAPCGGAGGAAGAVIGLRDGRYGSAGSRPHHIVDDEAGGTIRPPAGWRLPDSAGPLARLGGGLADHLIERGAVSYTHLTL